MPKPALVGAAWRRRVPRRRLGERLGFPDMFERTFDLSEYEPDTPFAIGELAVTPTRVPHYRLETYAFRVQSNGAVLDLLGRLGAVGGARASQHAMPISSCARRRFCEASSTASPVGTSPWTRPSKHSRRRAPSGFW